ncbi:MAG TPA: hypothetical protein EYP10_03225 [Armatimonadetes bacterium]|nr:hypothetical protein [Armatimonadota bacterium]
MHEQLLMEKALTLRGDVLEWVEAMRVPEDGYGRYRFAVSCREPDLYSSCIAVFIRDLLRDLNNLTDAQRQQWIEFIQSFQDPDTGYFIDSRVEPRDTATHSWDYLKLEMTHLSVSALDILGAFPRHPLRFLESLASAPALTKWLNQRAWVRRVEGGWDECADSEGKCIFHLGGLLISACEWGELSTDIVDALFRWLDQHVDADTGFWGTQEGCGLFNAMCGSAPIYALYFHQRRLVLYPNRAIDSILTLQQPDGLFYPRGGGMPEADFSAVMLLVGMIMRSEHRLVEVEACLRRVQYAIFAQGLHNDDGGFCANKRQRERIQHRGLEHISAHPWESDMLSTWLRCGILALISEATESPLTQVGWFIRENGEAATFAVWL